MKVFHGSPTSLEAGTRLTSRGAAYERDWSGTAFYAALERWRPDGCFPHRSAVFGCAAEEDVDCAGGATDYLCEIEVDASRVTWHDLNWCSLVSCLVADGHAIDSSEVREAALAYWSGEPHPDESVWECLAPEAVVCTCEPWEAPATSAKFG